MKKRILAVLLSAAMIVSDLPMFTMAADTTTAVETEAVELAEDGTPEAVAPLFDADDVDSDVVVTDVFADEANGSVSVNGGVQYASVKDQDIYINLDNKTGKKIKNVCLKCGNVVTAELQDTNSIYDYGTTVSARLYFNYAFNTIGKHDVYVEFEDGSAPVVAGTVEISDKPVLYSVYDIRDYDSTGDYIYIAVSGTALNPDKLSFKFINNGDEELKVTPEGWQFNNDGNLVYKFKKNSWNDVTSVNVKVSASDDTRIQNDSYYIYSSKDPYGFIYNGRTDKLEFYTPAKLANTTYSILLSRDASENAFAKGTVTAGPGTAVKVDLTDNTGAAFVPQIDYYSVHLWCTYTDDGQTKTVETYINEIFTTVEQNYEPVDWLNCNTYTDSSCKTTAYYVKAGKTLTYKVTVYDYNKSNVLDPKEVPVVKITDNTGKDVQTVTLGTPNVTKGTDSQTLVYTATIDTSKLAVGYYYIKAQMKGGSSSDYIVIYKDFVLSGTSLNYDETNDKFYANLDTRLAGEFDLSVELYDCSDAHKKVATAKPASKGSSIFYFTGIAKKDVLRQYYVKVVAAGAQVVRSSGKPYYSSEYGDKQTVNIIDSNSVYIDTERVTSEVDKKKKAYIGISRIYISSTLSDVQIILTSPDDITKKLSLSPSDLTKDNNNYYFGATAKKKITAVFKEDDIVTVFARGKNDGRYYAYSRTGLISYSDHKPSKDKPVKEVKRAAQDDLPFFNARKQTLTLLADASDNSLKTYTIDPQNQIKKYLKGSFSDFKFDSTNKSVATVDPVTGTVTAVGVGKTKIKITAVKIVKGKAKTVKATYTVLVKNKAKKVVPVKEALYLQNKYTVSKKGKVTAKSVTAKFKFDDKKVAKELVFFVSPEDQEFINVDASSNKLQGTGKMKISVKEQGSKLTAPRKINIGVAAWGNPDASANVVIVIGPKAAKGTKLEVGEVRDASNNSVIAPLGTKGAKKTQFAMKLDASANAVIKNNSKAVDNKDIAWTSNNKNYVTVDANGKFKVVGVKEKKGKKVATKVKITADYLGKKKSVTVVVTP